MNKQNPNPADIAPPKKNRVGRPAATVVRVKPNCRLPESILDRLRVESDDLKVKQYMVVEKLILDVKASDIPAEIQPSEGEIKGFPSRISKECKLKLDELSLVTGHSIARILDWLLQRHFQGSR